MFALLDTIPVLNFWTAAAQETHLAVSGRAKPVKLIFFSFRHCGPSIVPLSSQGAEDIS